MKEYSAESGEIKIKNNIFNLLKIITMLLFSFCISYFLINGIYSYPNVHGEFNIKSLNQLYPFISERLDTDEYIYTRVSSVLIYIFFTLFVYIVFIKKNIKIIVAVAIITLLVCWLHDSFVQRTIIQVLNTSPSDGVYVKQENNSFILSLLVQHEFNVFECKRTLSYWFLIIPITIYNSIYMWLIFKKIRTNHNVQ